MARKSRGPFWASDPAPPRPVGDIMATWANIGKAERLLGWRPQVGFEAGVQALVDWYQVNRDWAKDIITG